MNSRYRFWPGTLGIILAMVTGLVTSSGQASLVVGSIIYVDADAAGAGDGTSWADAFTALQPALEAAQSGDQLWVAAGTYIPSLESIPGDPRSASFQMKNGVAIYGGFAGGETELEQRDWVGNPTILSGDIGVVGEAADNSYHVFYHPSGAALDSSAVLDGFTITAGNANIITYPHMCGGGMYNDGSSPTLINVTFSASSAFYGGGMYNRDSSPSLTRVTFSTNHASNTGGGMDNSGSNPTLTEVVFFANSGGAGGGMYNFDSRPILMEVTFSTNSASYGGGMHNSERSPILTRVTFSTNAASYSGGGMYNFDYSSPSLTEVTFSGNTADSYGGGMANIESSSPILTEVTFSANASVFDGGGMYNDYGSNPVLTEAVFSVNTTGSASGGGMANRNDSNPTLTGVTFSGNSADSYGGGIFNYFSSSTLTNSILWGNIPDQIYGSAALTSITYSDIQGGYAGEGNIDFAPRFVRPPSPGGDGIWGSADDDPGDLRLQPDSPAIDAGNNDAVPAGILFDLSGAPRFVDIPAIPDTGLGIPPLVDMGAYEVQITIFLPLVWR